MLKKFNFKSIDLQYKYRNLKPIQFKNKIKTIRCFDCRYTQVCNVNFLPGKQARHDMGVNRVASS